MQEQVKALIEEGPPLDPKELVQYSALGATVGPVVGGLANLIQRGQFLPKDVPVKRFIPGSALTGAVYGGLIPVARYAIHRHNLQQKNKQASGSGQDLRTPVFGGTKFPTDDSKQYAQGLLTKSQKSLVNPKLAEVGAYMNDPLVQYLKKQAEAMVEVGPDRRTAGLNWSKGYRPHDKGELEYNEDDMPKGKEEFEMTSEPPVPTARMEEQGIDRWRGTLHQLFDSTTPPRRKLYEKDYSPTVGEVDAVLKKFE
jgi:hypothetical protein